MTDLIHALNAGAQVSSVAKVLAKGLNNEGRGYLVTIFDSVQMTERDYYLPYSEEADAILGL